MDVNVCAHALSYTTYFGGSEGPVHAGRSVVPGEPVCGGNEGEEARHEPCPLGPIYVVYYEAHLAQPGHLAQRKPGRIDVEVMQRERADDHVEVAISKRG